MGLEILQCAHFRILKKGVATLACHTHFIQSEYQQMNFTSEWLRSKILESVVSSLSCLLKAEELVVQDLLSNILWKD